MSRLSVAAVICSLTSACGAEGGADSSGPAQPPEGCGLEPAAEDFTYPPGPYGISVDDRFADFTLEDCDGTAVSFAQLLSNARLVLFNVGAGWCQPCIEETERMEAEIFRPFCGRGLRVVQVLFQDQDSGPATSLFCGQWRDANGLSFPVLKDPLFTTSTYFQDPASQTPLNMLVDQDARIIYREVGTPGADLPQRIDTLLPP